MRSCLSHTVAAVALGAVISLAVLSLVSMPAAAQNKGPAAKPDRVVTNEELQKIYLELPVAKLPTPRASDGHPDLTGFYYNLLDITGKRNTDGTVYYAFWRDESPSWHTAAEVP